MNNFHVAQKTVSQQEGIAPMKRNLLAFLLLVLVAGLAVSCNQGIVIEEKPVNTFTATYLNEEGRSIIISGTSDGMPGERSEFTLNINNNAEHWQGEYYVLLVDRDSVVEEIRHEQLDIQGGGGIQTPIIVEYPEGFMGALGLCVLTPQHGTLITALSVGTEQAISTGWFDIHSYPISN